VLHAWHAWGEDCVQRLLGDFAFAIWDAASRRLFCARDPFGIKPCYYSANRSRLVFSNTLDALRSHPDVGDDLDELAIADFLIFEINQDPSSTSFKDIRRLPAASRLLASQDGIRVERYWEVPQAEVRYRRARDYADHFRELFARAVEDRVRADRVVVSMSGGLDSPSVAAMAKRTLERRARPYHLGAHTAVYDRLVRDEERHYAGLAASSLGIPIRFYPADDFALYERFGELMGRFPDPYHAPDNAAGFEMVRRAAGDARVMLTGFDADTLLNEPPRPYLRTLAAGLRLARLAEALLGFAVAERRLVPRSWLGGRRRAEVAPAGFPGWLEPGLVARHGLRERWELAQRGWMQGGGVRPSTRQYLEDFMRYSFFFDSYDPGVTRVPMQVRHPFLDVRLVSYCLSLPPVPWCVRKAVLRTAMRDALPKPILARPKTPAPGWPAIDRLRRPESRWIDEYTHEAGMEHYVLRNGIPKVTGASEPLVAWMNLRPLTLALWLRQARSFRTPARSQQHETA
jgi:asparagine synthase (glutamine-hydrolysing)